MTPLPEPLQDFAAAGVAFASEFARFDVLRDRLTDAHRTGAILSNTLESIRVELTYHSNAIEGNTLSLRETQLVLEGFTPESSRPMRELYEARNHHRAIQLVESLAQSSTPDAQLTDRDILDIHACVLADIDKAEAGRFRAGRVLIAGTRHIPPGPHRFPDLLPAMLDLSARRAVHPVLRAAELHYNFVAVHPFSDGNGRTGRLLMNYVLLRHGFPLSIIEVDSRKEYLSALDDSNAGRTEPFLRLVVRCLNRAFERLGISE